MALPKLSNRLWHTRGHFWDIFSQGVSVGGDVLLFLFAQWFQSSYRWIDDGSRDGPKQVLLLLQCELDPCRKGT